MQECLVSLISRDAMYFVDLLVFVKYDLLALVLLYVTQCLMWNLTFNSICNLQFSGLVMFQSCELFTIPIWK